MAQSTYQTPYPGFTHTYNVTLSTSGLSTRWYVATDKNGTRATQGSTGDYEITSTEGGSWNSGAEAWSGSGVYSVAVSWKTGLSAGDKYYVFVEVDDASTGACTNKMAMEVTIGGAFNAYAYNVTGASDYNAAADDDPGIKAQDCPAEAVDPVWNTATSTHINSGTTTAVFKVERQFSALAWAFQYSINSGVTTGINNVVINNESGVALTPSGTNVVSLAADQDYALVYVTMDNVQGATINVTFDIVTSNSETKDTDGNLDTSNDHATYTILPIPVITGFSGID